VKAYSAVVPRDLDFSRFDFGNRAELLGRFVSTHTLTDCPIHRLTAKQGGSATLSVTDRRLD
jgi:hypothetical protein